MILSRKRAIHSIGFESAHGGWRSSGAASCSSAFSIRCTSWHCAWCWWWLSREETWGRFWGFRLVKRMEYGKACPWARPFVEFKSVQARQLDPKKSLLAYTKPSSWFLPRMVLTHKKKRLCHLWLGLWKSQLQQLWKIRPLRQRQLDLHPDQMQQVKARTPRTLAWTAACFPRWPGPTRILLATGRQDFLGTTRWFSSPCLFSPFAFLFPFLLPLPCHSSAGVWVRATDRELEGRSWEKNCPPSRSYRRGSWEAAESRSSSNKWLLREEVAERRGVSPQQRKVARPCSPIHPFIHPSLHSFIR